MADWTHDTATANGVDLHYVAAGPDDGPLVVLLHGFPEFWYSWRRQLSALADAGFRAVAPDMRGYNESEKPAGVAAYRVERLVGDLAGLVERLGRGTAHVVGHDWGALVAWEAAVRRPAVVDRLVALQVPHPGALERELRTPRQLGRSWYVAFFQLPRLPEAVLRARDYRAIEAMFAAGSPTPGTFSRGDVERYKDAIAKPGALAAALNYYRAYVRQKAAESARNALRGRGFRSDVALGGRVDAPSLVLFGERDPAIDVAATRGLDRWVPDCRVERFPDAGHWPQVERPARVDRLLVEFLG